MKHDNFVEAVNQHGECSERDDQRALRIDHPEDGAMHRSQREVVDNREDRGQNNHLNKAPEILSRLNRRLKLAVGKET